METPVLDDFIARTLAQYVPGHLSGTRIRTAAVAVAADPEPEYVDPNDVLDDEDEKKSDSASTGRPHAVYVHAIRRFAPPRRA